MSDDDKQCGIDGSFHTNWDSLPSADPIGDIVRWQGGSARIVVKPASVPMDAGRVARSGSQIVTNKAGSPFRVSDMKHLLYGEFNG